MLKFAEFANVGDVIKAYDFKPMPEYAKADYPDMYMTGKVVAKGKICNPHTGAYMYDGYTIEIIDADEQTREGRIGDTGFVPFEVSMMEYDERIELVATADEMADIAEEFNV